MEREDEDDAFGPAADAPQVFISDASAEAERIAATLRRAGYLVVDVPLSMLYSRVAVQRPHLVLVDGEAEGAVDEVARIQSLPECATLDVLFLGRAASGHGHVARPVDAPALLARVDSITGGPPRQLDRRSPSGPPPDRPSFRPSASQSMSALPSPGMRASDVPARPSSMLPPEPDAEAKSAVRASAPVMTLGSALPASLREGDLPPKSLATHAALSPELQQLLAEAEAREMGAHDGPSEASLPSPDQEIEAVLPAQVLASLDDPIDEEDEGDSEPAIASRPTTASGRSATGRRPLSDMPHKTPSGTGPGTGAGVSTTGTRSDPGVSTTGDDGSFSEVARTHPPAPSSSRPDAWGVQSTRNERVAPPAAPTAPGRRGISVNRLVERPSSMPPPTIHRPERAERAEKTPVRPPTPLPPAPTGTSSRALSPGEAARMLAFAVARRSSGALCFEEGGALRRIVLREGDVVTAASDADPESLLAYLALRGDVPRSQAVRLSSRVPPFGRHAGAALVAHGVLPQDQLWEALRGHAEWISVICMKLERGTATVESEAPGRLKGEPSVFGGAAGPEVFVEICRRAFSPEEALGALGGPREQLASGPNQELLRECGLAPDEERAALEARSAPLGEVLARSPESDLASTLYALVLLGVLEGRRGPARAPDPASSAALVTETEIEALEEEAVRARVRARLDLVEEGDYFAVLGVPRDATGYEIRRAFLELRRSFEPARILSPRLADLVPDVDTINAVVEEAYDVLRDAARRERYRRAIES